MQSVSKSITSLVLGIAMTRGEFPSIDTDMLAFFPDREVEHLDDRKGRMTVRHLLTMTAGFDWDESTVEYTDPRNNCAVMEGSEDWVQYVLDRPMAAEPGSTWVYNSGATVLLAEMFQQSTGQDLAVYAEANLFQPLGITRTYWKRTPLGLPDTEGGLYLEAQDLAKIGLLMLRGGEWDGTRIVSSDWIAQSVVPAMEAGAMKYGFKWWLVPYGPGGTELAWAGNGYGGQRLIVLPEEDVVAVFTGWNIDEHPTLPMQEMTERIAAAVRD
jgi:CubicO group peptidase (beta-lactamase class C family)